MNNVRMLTTALRLPGGVVPLLLRALSVEPYAATVMPAWQGCLAGGRVAKTILQFLDMRTIIPAIELGIDRL
jgi:hypothetical protein